MAAHLLGYVGEVSADQLESRISQISTRVASSGSMAWKSGLTGRFVDARGKRVSKWTRSAMRSKAGVSDKPLAVTTSI